MFPYFGRKQRLASSYPKPLYGLPIVEPFAGSMGYSQHHEHLPCVGLEADERVVELWERMGRVTEIPSVPVVGEKTDDLLIKLCAYSEHSLTSGEMTVTSRMVRDWDSVHLKAMAAGVWGRQVDYRLGDYTDAPDIEATWFIDPPYQHASRRGYRHRFVDYEALGDWAQTRQGLVIVCEQAGADWLPFDSFRELATHRGATSDEVVWIKE